jgi:DNA-binding CsgD family transcriptional regulator
MSASLLTQYGTEWSYNSHRPESPAPASQIEDDSTRLSEREQEIMHWVGHGKTNVEIGMILGISQFTVKNHLQRIFRKIDVRNRAQAISRILALSQTSPLQ